MWTRDSDGRLYYEFAAPCEAAMAPPDKVCTDSDCGDPDCDGEQHDLRHITLAGPASGYDQ